MNRSRIKIAAAGAGALTVLAASAFVMANGSDDAPQAATANDSAQTGNSAQAGIAAQDQAEDEVWLAEAKSRRPSQTAQDWVTYADHVVEVTVVDEEELPPTQTEIERGEGLTGRKVTLKVNKVLWSAPDAPKAAPETIVEEGTGWVFQNHDDAYRVKMAMEDAPRVEASHTYVQALEWVPDSCDPSTGQWMGLGNDSIVPYDDGILGNGENEGTVQSAAAAEAALASDDPNASLEDKMIGMTAEDLVAKLEQTQPGVMQQRTADGICDPEDE